MTTPARRETPLLHCPRCRRSLEVAASKPGHTPVCPTCHGPLAPLPPSAYAPTIQAASPVARSAVDPAPARQSAPVLADPEGEPFGRYRLLGEIGRGGMGAVYKAWDTQLRRVVALKLLLSQEFAGEAEVERFLREARAAARLHHPNIVQVHDSGVQDGRRYFTMDLIEGKGLDAVKSTLSPRRFLEVLREVALALHAAHQTGIVHRDVKPANVLIDPEGRPFVTDFGLAKEIKERSGPKVTVSGALLGTPQYMSPEQAQGQMRRIGPRSDVWSLGIILYEHLTGRLPFEGASLVDLLGAIAHDDPGRPTLVAAQRRLPRQVHSDLETICLKCLEKDPARRYPAAADFAEDLRRFLDGEPIAARRSTILEHGIRWVRRRPEVTGCAVAGVLTLVAFFAIAIRQRVMQAELEDLRGRLVRATDPREQQELERQIAERLGAPAVAPPKVQEAPPPAPSMAAPVPPSEAPPKASPSHWPGVKSRALELAAKGRYAEALKSIGEFSTDSPEERFQIVQAAEEVRALARSAFERTDAEARRQEADGEFARARESLKPFLTCGIPAIVEPARARMVEIDAAAEAAAKKAATAGSPAGSPATDLEHAAALKIFEDVRDEILALCSARQYDESLAEIARRRGDLAPCAPDFDVLSACVREAKTVTTAVPAGAAALRGETISLQMGEGEIRGGSERDLRVSLKASKAEVAVPYSSLRSTELVRLAEAGGATSEARGLFWLFEGSPEEARRAWSASSRRAELDGFAALVEASALDREGRELLRALLAAADKRDWKSCRKILEQRPRLAGAKSWIEASAQIDEIVESSAESVEDPLYAVAPRRKGETLLWSYDFEKPEELRDWRMEAGDIHRTDHCQHPTGYGLRLDQGSLILRNARLNFLAPLVGELRIEADLTLIESEKTPCIYVGVGGYRWTVEQESAMLETPLGKTPGVHGPPLKPGVLHRIALSVDRRGVSVRLDGRVLFSAPVDEALRAGPPSVQLFRNTTIRLDRVVVTGTPRRDWVAAERERRALLAGVGRKYALGAAQILTDGKSLGKFEKGDEGVWEVVDGALRGTGSSPEGNSGLYAPVFRNFRFRMKYRPETARYIDFSPRQGGHAWLGLCLPVAAPEEWHDIEVVAVETAATCVLDGGVMLGLSMSEGVFTEKVRIMIRDGHSSLKDVTLEEIKGAPPDPSVALYDGFELGPVASAPSWTVDAQGKKSWERRLLVGSGDLQSRDSWKDMDVRLRIEGMAKTRIQLLLRGGAVMDWTFPKDGLYTVFVYAKGDSADVYVNDHVHAPARLKASPGPVRLTVSQGIAKVHEFRVRPVR